MAVWIAGAKTTVVDGLRLDARGARGRKYANTRDSAYASAMVVDLHNILNLIIVASRQPRKTPNRDYTQRQQGPPNHPFRGIEVTPADDPIPQSIQQFD
jgi:hypothetical protein